MKMKALLGIIVVSLEYAAVESFFSFKGVFKNSVPPSRSHGLFNYKAACLMIFR
jgi:hypothetical protein